MAEKEEKKLTRVRNELKGKGDNDRSEPEFEMPEKIRRTETKTKEEAGEEKPLNRAKKPREKNSKKSWNPFSRFISRIRGDEKLHKITGAFLVFIVTPYLAAAFASYFFTWQADQDKVMGPVSVLLSQEVEVYNVLGKFGAVISHLFIHNWFGISSFFFPVFSLVAGLRLLSGITILPVGKTFTNGLFALIFGSVALGYIFRDAYFYP
ncbi:MAG TPA: DNA translocase FtsK 4TM domain-containing protein, partial [Bacteroidia bacterium]|nr:DNA translocase FtsK 4TM domain-containing protein [Bacteroidia bacterium]